MSFAVQPLAWYPKASYVSHRAEIDDAVTRVLRSGRYVLGEEVSAFEHEFADYLGVAHCVGVASGTDALHLALRACGVSANDLVLTVSHTAVATVAAIELAGATPLLADIDLVNYTIDLTDLRRLVAANRGRVKALIPVHLYGHPADMEQIMEIASEHALTVIEDCAQAHGATFHGRRAGTWGHMGAFSFYPTKNLAAMGDGGAVVTNHRQFAERIRELRQYGWRTRYVSEVGGLNSRLDEIQAAILRVKLLHLDAENARRKYLASHYDRLLEHLEPLLRRPGCAPGVEHVYHQYVVRTRQRDSLASHLRQGGIETAILYPQPVHLQPAYIDRLPLASSTLPVTEEISKEILSLPIHPHLRDADVQEVGRQIAQALPTLAR